MSHAKFCNHAMRNLELYFNTTTRKSFYCPVCDLRKRYKELSWGLKFETWTEGKPTIEAVNVANWPKKWVKAKGKTK